MVSWFNLIEVDQEMVAMVERFPTGYYQAHEIMVCPNGDKVRSDGEGLFCWLDGERVAYPVVPGEGIRRVPTVSASTAGQEDGEGEGDEEENSAPAIAAVPTKKPAAKKPAATKKPAAKKPAAKPSTASKASEPPAGVSSNANG